MLYWDSAAEFEAALGGEHGKAAIDDLPNFAGAGVNILTGPVEAVV